MSSFTEALIALGLGIFLLLIASLTFDVVHVCLHQFSSSRWPLLRWIGGLHSVHHEFLDRNLRIHEDRITANVWCHVIPEYVVQVTVTACLGALLQLPLLAIILGVTLETLVFLLIMKPTSGFDVNHRHVDRLRAYRPLYFCVPEYHLLHHVYPDAYFGSWLKTLDHLLGTGTSVMDRKVALTGGTSVCGQAFRQGSLINNPVVDIDGDVLGQPEKLRDILGGIDILVLCHPENGGATYRDIIDLFYQIHQQRRVPVEVWAIAQPDEFRSNRDFADYAKKLFRARKVIYRHLVIPSSPRSADLVAVQKRIRRGYNYVAARWDASTLRHCLRFLRK